MTKIETATTEIEHCGECPDCFVKATGKKGWRCGKGGRIVRDLWGEIPSWCLLPNKESK